MKERKNGLTLIGLLTIIAVLGTILAFNVPRIAKKHHQIGAKIELKTLLILEKKYLARNGTYSTSLESLKYTPPDGLPFMFSIAGADGNSCTLVARGKPKSDVSREVWQLVITNGQAGEPQLQ